MAATAVHQARTFESNPASFNGEDLLRETLVTPQGQSEQQEIRDYTDDLEDLVRMQVTQQLHSRRSHQTIDFSSYPPPPPLSPTTATSSQAHRSLIPRLQPTASRSPSPEVVAVRDKERSGSISSSRSLSRIPVGSTGMLRGNSNTSNTSNLSSTYEEENKPNHGREEEEERWETLQVGSHHPFPQPIQSTTPTRNRQPQARPSGDPTRKRVQTNNHSNSKSIPRALHPSSTPQSSSSSSRKPYSNRTNYTPSPSSTTTTRTKKPSSSSSVTPIRRKSMSASTSTTTPREFSSYDLSSLPPEAFSPSSPTTTSNLPPPIPIPLSESLKISSETCPNSLKPLIYKNSKGELTDTGREEDRIIPTVAKKLEAERLKKLLERGELVQDGCSLVDEWGVDGTPQKQRMIEEKRRSRGDRGGGGEVDTEKGREGERVDEKENESSNEKPLPSTGGSRLGDQTQQQQSTIENGTGQEEKSSTAPPNRRTEVPREDRDAAKAGCCSCIIC
ncbi:hypothetical protein JCM5350_004430 [Sporobolomyces pararoseus]